MVLDVARVQADAGLIRGIDLRGNEIGPPGAVAITTALTTTGNKTLASLSLNGNPIGHDGGLALAAWLKVCGLF